MSTSQKVVVVTGASQGIGSEVVRAFRKLDHLIVATSRSINPSEDENVLSIAGDIGDRRTVQRVISDGVARFGRIDTLVNNAGIYLGKPFIEHTVEDYAAVMNVNMAGFFHITQLAIAEMEKRSSGHVVTLTTSIDQIAYSGVYTVLAAMRKGGLNAATKSLAIEYAKKSIRVNAVASGNIKTPMHAPEYYQALAAMQPISGMGDAIEIADAILFLDQASFITGKSYTSTVGRVPATEIETSRRKRRDASSLVSTASFPFKRGSTVALRDLRFSVGGERRQARGSALYGITQDQRRRRRRFWRLATTVERLPALL